MPADPAREVEAGRKRPPASIKEYFTKVTTVQFTAEQRHSAGLRDVVTPKKSQWELIKSLTRREISSRYKGSVLGILWALLNPLVMLIIYSFVFINVFNARWSSAGLAAPPNFTLMLFVGTLVFGFFAEVLTRASTDIVTSPSLVKKLIFPLETRAFVLNLSALFHTAITFAIFLCAFPFLKGAPPWTAILFPLVLLPLWFVNLGIYWILSSLGVFMRDISQIIGHLTMMLMFLSPIFYPASALPERLRVFFNLNPLAFIIEQSRNVLVLGRQPDWLHLAIFLIGSILFAWLALNWFQRLRNGFADVL